MDKNVKFYLVEFSKDCVIWFSMVSFVTFDQALIALGYLRSRHEDSFFRVVQVFDC